MSAIEGTAQPIQHSGSRTTFFRQSSWMLFATVASGACMFLVHPFSKMIPDSEYGVLGTLLAILHCMGIPTVGLQMVFAQQAAAAITEEQHRRLAATTRALWIGTTAIWLIAVLVISIGHQQILTRLKIANPAALWVTVLVGLGVLWQPIFNGIVQGHQKFFWLGTSSMLAGVGRLASVAIIVLLLHGYAAGIMTGALIGTVAALTVILWHSRDVWMVRGGEFDGRGWLKRVIPLSLGFGASQFMFSADPIFVQSYFMATETPPYMAAGTLARALILFTSPLAAVMFPKVVRSVARAEKTDVMVVALATTAVLVGMAALGLSLVGPWLVEIVFKKSFGPAASLLPWFAFGMAPLALANILVNNLLARERFAVVPALVVVALGYASALVWWHDSFVTVIRVLGVSNLAFLGVAAWFTWGRRTA
jgi:O-antigen/teichoic acid export membrane protein